MADFLPFSWDDPALAGDKKPNSPDDKECGDHYISKWKDCHDGGAHRPEPGNNPYWSGDNSADERNSRGEGWESTKPKTKKSPQDDPVPSEEKEEISFEEEFDTQYEEDQRDEAITYHLQRAQEDQAKALDPARQTRVLKPEEIRGLHKKLQEAGDRMSGILLRLAMAKNAQNPGQNSRNNEFLKMSDQLAQWKQFHPTDSSSLDEYAAKLNEFWDVITQSPIGQQMLEGKQFGNIVTPPTDLFDLKFRYAQAQNTLDLYKASKREDSSQDLLKWNTLATKPEMMTFADIPDLAWRELPEGPQSEDDLRYMADKLSWIEKHFATWAQTGGRVNGAHLAEQLLGRPSLLMDSILDQSPWLPNPKAAKMILDRSARVGDEKANAALWYEFGMSENWSGNSYLHDYKKATSKAMEEAQKLGLDIKGIQEQQRATTKSERQYKAWMKNVYEPEALAVSREWRAIDVAKVNLEVDPTVLQAREKAVIEREELNRNAKVARVRARAEAKAAADEHIEKNRLAFVSALVKANEKSRISEETLGNIANAFAGISYAKLDPSHSDYKGAKGKRLLQKRQAARSANLPELMNQKEVEATFSHMLSVLHGSLLNGTVDANNTKFSAMVWNTDEAVRAHADPSDNSILLDRNDSGETLVHEFGHHLEFNNRRVQERILDFYEARTKGKKSTGKRGYKRNERFKSGKFFNEYVGKDYGPRKPHDTEETQQFTEVLSMGIQAIYSKRYWQQMVTKDPEHLALIIATIRGY